MAPLTRNRARRDGVPSRSAVIYYAQRASAALIVTEATAVSPDGVGYPFTPGIHTDDQVAGWKPVVDAVHRFGSRFFLQLFHAGRISHPSLQPEGRLPVAPSAIAAEGQTATYAGTAPFVAPRALTTDEIPRIVEQFRMAARNALHAGFDGVEIHGANGYLLDQFLRDGANRRTDAYGGSTANRIRLFLQVTEAVADLCGADRVGVRISPSNAFNSMADSHPEKTFRTLVSEVRADRGAAEFQTVAQGHARMVFQPTAAEADWFADVFHLENFGLFERSYFTAQGSALTLMERVRFLVALGRRSRGLDLGFWPWCTIKERAGALPASLYATLRRWQP